MIVVPAFTECGNRNEKILYRTDVPVSQKLISEFGLDERLPVPLLVVRFRTVHVRYTIDEKRNV